jgi:hypothetical protein
MVDLAQTSNAAGVPYAGGWSTADVLVALFTAATECVQVGNVADALECVDGAKAILEGK